MINKELKRLNRRELVDIIYQLKKNEEELEAQIETLKTELEDKRIKLTEAGTIADAALSITDIFGTAQATADLYLSEINALKEETKKECEQMIEEANQRVDGILSAGKKQFAEMKANYLADLEKWEALKQEIEKLEENK